VHNDEHYPVLGSQGVSVTDLEYEANESFEPGSEITYAEQYYPARPRPVRPTVRRHYFRTTEQHGEPNGLNDLYVTWLHNQSMLADANVLSQQVAGQGVMWQNPYAYPNPTAAIDRAGVWYTAYPISMITAPGTSYLKSLASAELWRIFATVGINAIHTGPVKEAGGILGWQPTPSVDGHFDRISMQIDPAFGTEEEFRELCEVSASFGGITIDDIVPGHTGKGSDFRLAEMRYGEYPGIYHMVEIPPEDWNLLPEVPEGQDAANLSARTEADLAAAGYIIGQLQRVIFAEPGVKETNWSATNVVRGVDGVERRWVYLHYFKAGQPSINWLDPSCAGMRLVMGDACHSIADLGTGALRLDANGFLGVEKSASGAPAWSEGHPLSEAANHLIAGMVRKMGGFTFQELNLAIDDIRETGESGADLSYDFINRPAYQHALVTGNTEFLRLTLNLTLQYGIRPGSLVHALQNHDELTHELVHFSTRHANDLFAYGGAEMTGFELGDRIRTELIQGLTGPNGPYNRPFTTNGIACTTGSVITAALGITDLDAMTPEDIERVCYVHLLLAMFNALQPGVFALSGWDLCGVLPLDIADVRELISDGDTRWINRGALDLMNVRPEAERSSSGMKRARSLYGSLPDQMRTPGSFARRLQKVLRIRNQYAISTSEQVDVPNVGHPGMLVMIHRLVSGQMQATVLNFSGDEVLATVHSDHLPAGGQVTDMATQAPLAFVDELGNFPVSLQPHEGLALLIDAPLTTTDAQDDGIATIL
jgi:trehalose synthase